MDTTASQCSIRRPGQLFHLTEKQASFRAAARIAQKQARRDARLAIAARAAAGEEARLAKLTKAAVANAVKVVNRCASMKKYREGFRVHIVNLCSGTRCPQVSVMSHAKKTET